MLPLQPRSTQDSRVHLNFSNAARSRLRDVRQPPATSQVYDRPWNADIRNKASSGRVMTFRARTSKLNAPLVMSNALTISADCSHIPESPSIRLPTLRVLKLP